jgi:hypothetical protein
LPHISVCSSFMLMVSLAFLWLINIAAVLHFSFIASFQCLVFAIATLSYFVAGFFLPMTFEIFILLRSFCVSLKLSLSLSPFFHNYDLYIACQQHVYLGIYLGIYLSRYISIYLGVYLSILVYIYLSRCLSIYLGIYLFIYLPRYLCTYVGI